MRKVVSILLVSGLFAFANFSDENIAKSIKEIAKAQQIDQKLLYSIAKVESNFEPLVIAFVSSKKDFKFDNAQTTILPYKNKNLIQIRANETRLKEILRELTKNGYKVDVGLMQINSMNFDNHEVDLIFQPKYNLFKSAQVLKSCNGKFRDLKEILECYNKGFGKKNSYEYYSKVKETFISSFGGSQ